MLKLKLTSRKSAFEPDSPVIDCMINKTTNGRPTTTLANLTSLKNLDDLHRAKQENAILCIKFTKNQFLNQYCYLN